jgi:hypothetical protein
VFDGRVALGLVANDLPKWSNFHVKICGGCQSFIQCEGAKPGQRRRAFSAEGLGPCPVGVPGFESPPPHHKTSTR